MFNSTQEYADYQQLLSELSTVGRNTLENQTIFADFASRYNRILNLTTANFHTLSALVVPIYVTLRPSI